MRALKQTLLDGLRRANSWLENPWRFAALLTASLLVALYIAMFSMPGQDGAYDDFRDFLGDSVIGLDRVIMGTLTVCALWAAVVGRVSPVVLFAAMGASFYDLSNQAFIEHIHPFIHAHATWAYRIFFWKTGNSEVMHEHTKLLIQLCIFSVLLIQFAVAKWRTVDRTFFALSLTAVLCTFFLFHTTNLLRIAHYEVKQENYMRAAFSSKDPSVIQASCQSMGLECHIAGAGIIDRYKDHLPEFTWKHFDSMPASVRAREQAALYFVPFASQVGSDLSANFGAKSLLGHFPTFVVWDRQSDFSLVVHDYHNYASALVTGVNIVAILVSIAHTVWFFLLMNLWLFHRKKAARIAV